MVLPIVTYPDKVLRERAKPVSFPLSQEVKKLTADMVDTVRSADGIGLAAPQVNQPYRIIVINLENSGVPPIVLYNAKIVSKSLRKTEIEEGCLSLPGVFGKVKRPKKVTIEARDAFGKTVRITDDGWIARVAQHEIDHTDGVLIIDLIKNYTQGEEIARKWKEGDKIKKIQP